METLVQVAQLLLALSILVGIHEGGHMIAAKMFGMKVEKFFIGFPPTLFSFKKGETEYGLGAIPLGGFVKITGMIDESMDTEAMKAPPQPWEFRSKPAWQRLIVMLGGIIVNVVAGVLAMIILTYNQGDEYYSSELTKDGIQALEYGEQFGFQTGDKVVSVNGEDYERLDDLTSPDLFLDSDAYYTVLRNGEELRIELPDDALDILSKDKAFRLKFIYPRMPFAVTYPEDPDFQAQSNAKNAGILVGDRIVQVGEQSIEYWDQMTPALVPFADSVVNVKVNREGAMLDFQLAVNKDTTIGIQVGALLESTREEYSLGQAASIGTKDAFNLVIVNARAMGKMFSGDLSARSLSGPIGIVELFPKAWDWNRFWYTTAFISMILAFMNLLPIPALDGGHVVFLLYEMISGSAPSDKFLEGAQKVGMVILLALMVFVFGNDILKLFGI